MRTRAIAAFLLLPFVAACTSSYQVRVEDAPRIASGNTVPLAEGGTVEVRDDYSVRVLPFPGAVFVPDGHGAYVPVPKYEAPAGQAIGAGPWLHNPVDSAWRGGLLLLRDPEGIRHYYGQTVYRLEIKQTNPGKTVGMVVGIGIPSLAGAGLIAVLVAVVASGGFNVGVGCC